MFGNNHIQITRRVDLIEGRITDLERHKTDCDMMHEQHKEHKKRSDDAMNNLTDSNMMLAKSITDMNVTLTRVVRMVESDRPEIKIVRNAAIAWDVNRKIFAAIVAIASGIGVIYAALNYL